MVKGLLLSSALAALAAVQPAQAADAPGLTLERVFASPDINGPSPRALRLSPDGSLLTVLRNRADEKERYDLWALDPASGAWRMLVDSSKVGTGAELSEAEKMQRERLRSGGIKGILTYDWTADGKAILVPLDGDLYLAGLDGAVRRLTNTPEGELNPIVSPRGSFVSFVRGQNLFVTDIATGAERALTGDGGGTVHWGEAEFVAQEEMDRRTGYWWSPDERHVAVERFDEAPVGVVSRAAIGAEGTRVYDQRYPAAGTPNVLVELYVVKADGSGRIKVDLGGNPDIYLTRVNWLPDGSALLVQRMSRDQKRLDMLRVDAATGAATLLFSETSDHWVNLGDSLRPLKDGSLIWWSQRDGYGHLYRWNKGRWTQLTKGAWEVSGLVGVDEARGRIYFSGNKDSVLERQLYAVDIARPNAISRITEPGWWTTATMDGAASRIIVSRSNPDQPTQTYLADAAGKRLAWVSENPLDAAHPYAPFLASHEPTRFGTLKAADGSTLHWKMITPRLEPGKRYPVLFEHYGGPHSQQVSRNWGGALHQYIVDRGYIVFVLDNRGSANRGTAFEGQIYHAMGGVEVQDQLAGAAWLKSQPFVDADRIATYGWSYGGYMTLKMLAAAPGAFAAGVAGAPVTKWELYDTFYTERYLGDPGKDVESYARSNALADADRIVDPLLLIHGMADDNVLFENSTALMARMQLGGKPFETMVYPGQTHSFGDPRLRAHTWMTILNFLDAKMGRGTTGE
ncbi:DPP IV N-terminal domain-containing protein [uncultured Sphingomonas sp.]|uniref:S9 family peptidase n=1 Tax=uncultured Sphingomonas sp. TaxID=158754 RepID=UPI002630035A|nr:DPP IV N-terminal domain-containing protein [uncultured Sphingomonas sp.]